MTGFVTPSEIGGPVLLVGAFGQRNPGDEALLSAFMRALPDVPLIAASTDPLQTAELHGIEAVDSRSWRAVARAVNRSTAVVFAGGTVFKTLPDELGRGTLTLLRNALALSSYARARNRLVLHVGVGVGRLDAPGAARLARLVVSQADLLVVRDGASARLLAAAGVPAPLRVGADPAWTLLDEVPVRTSDGDRIVVVPSRWAVLEAAHHLEALAHALRPLVADGMRVQVQPWQIGGASGLDDRDHAHRLAALLDHRVDVLAPPVDLVAAAHTYAGSRLVISGRFHGLVAAASMGVRCLAVANEPKQGALAARLDQQAVAVDATPLDVEAAVARAGRTAPPAASAVRAEIATADEAFGLLRLMLSEGGHPAESISGLRLEPVW